MTEQQIREVLAACPVGGSVRLVVSAHPRIPQHLQGIDRIYKRDGRATWRNLSGLTAWCSGATITRCARNWIAEGRAVTVTLLDATEATP